MTIELAFRNSAAINADHNNSSGCRTFCKKMVAVLLPSEVALHSSMEHAVKVICEQISVTLNIV